MLTTVLLSILTMGQASDVPLITIDRDNIEITRSCRVRIAQTPIIDADNNGVIHITASNVAVTFADDSPALHGAKDDQTPDTFAGKGITITGRNATLSDAKVSGYKVGIHAMKADGLTVHHCDVSNNFHQRLKSTPQAEDASDWLWPHANDNNEWIANYGAGLCVEDSSNVALHDIRARKTQNGIILDAVNDSKVYDCDCSFLSGWGLAMWRSSRNVISRNAFDFCVRGYSHGVYNRGQDSAGVLMFEQCCDNVIAENSATHGGDGFFGFAGKEALGEVNPREDVAWYNMRGNNGNVFMGNDFSYAVAHGLELTFSASNAIWNNRFVGNGICGIWGGYSRATEIGSNLFEDNGEMAYGLERGGINIEHGWRNLILRNTFRRNRCGVHLWWDDDGSLLRSKWAEANGTSSEENSIEMNTFEGDTVAVHLRACGFTQVRANKMTSVGSAIDADTESKRRLVQDMFPSPEHTEIAALELRDDQIIGRNRPSGSRAGLVGRHNIIMTEWGPWDHESPLLQFARRFDGGDEYILRGANKVPEPAQITIDGNVMLEISGAAMWMEDDGQGGRTRRVARNDLPVATAEHDHAAPDPARTIRITPREAETIFPYRIALEIDGQTLQANGVVAGGAWIVKTFPSTVDPREDAERWRNEGLAQTDVPTLGADWIDFLFGSGGMSELRGLPVALPRDHFGTICTRSLTVPAGRWRITTTSDDGIRVWMDEQLVIDDWTHHAPKKHTHDFEVAEGGRRIEFRVEHFELDGYAVLQLDIAPIP